MNIAFFSEIQLLGGGELWVLKMARALGARGHSVSIVCPWRSALFHAALEAGYDVFGFSAAGGAPVREALYHFLSSRNVDVVYCTIMARQCEAVSLAQILTRINEERNADPAILLLKTGLPPARHLSPEYYGFGGPPLLQQLHVVSEEDREQFLDWQGAGPAVERFVTVMREGVELGRFRPEPEVRAAARASWGVRNGTLTITCASRLSTQKGQDNLLLAAGEVAAVVPDVRFILAGEGADRSRLERLRDHLGLQDRVTFAGQVQDVPGLLAATDIFCHPSLNDGLPNAVAEAMAMGLPVVASRVGGIPELVEDGRTGVLVRPHDVAGIRDALLRLIGDSELRNALGVAARQRVRERLDFDVRVGVWVEAVAERLLEFRRSRGPAPPPVRKRQTAWPVLFLLNVLRTGGEETETAILARYLDRSRFPMFVMTGWSADEPAPVAEVLSNLRIPVDTSCHALSSIEEKAERIVRFVREHQIRLLVACQDTRLAWHVMQRLQPGECKLIEHAGIAREVHAIPKDRTDALIAVSQDIAREAAPLFADPQRVRFLASMVDLSAYDSGSRSELRTAYGFQDDCIILFVGRLDAKKGIDDLIDAAAAVLPEHPSARFLVVGPPDAFQPAHARRLLDRAAAELPKNRFIFAGARKDVASILCAADICVLPSRGEGMSHVINEAGAAGLPVVAYDDGAAGEQLEGGQAGILVAPGDRAGLAAALKLLVSDPGLRASLGKRLRDRVVREYTVQRIVPQWHAIFNELVATLPSAVYAPMLKILPEDKEPPFPTEVQIETNTACNATCVMCPYPEVSKELPPGRMDQPLYEKILDECAAEPALWRIEPFLNNEPFTDTRMVDWIAMTKQRVPRAMVTVTTNGSLVTPKITDRLIQSGLDAIWFSFNGATKETYESIMGLSFDTVKRNIDYLLSVKPESLRVFTNMIDTIPMKGEIAENIRYWQSRGVQSGSSPLVNRAGNVRNFTELNYKPLGSRAVRVCELVFHKMYIGYNGDVLLCCMDWRRRVVLGNVRHQTMREIWHGERYREYRHLQARHRSQDLELCADCSYVQA